MFTAYPTYNPYRVLYDRKPKGLPRLFGEDVYALQCALNYFVGAGLKLDGILGKLTADAIEAAQIALGFTGTQIDRAAGQLTQRRLELAILTGRVAPGSKWYRLETGQLEHEASFLMGNYSALRGDFPDFDAGAAQRNGRFHPLADAFNPVDSINLLVSSNKDAYRRYVDTSQFRPHTDDPEIRRFKLAAGSWNAPAFADYYAGVGSTAPNAAGAAAFLAYIEDVAVYL
jgi:hypothetical protein